MSVTDRSPQFGGPTKSQTASSSESVRVANARATCAKPIRACSRCWSDISHPFLDCVTGSDEALRSLETFARVEAILFPVLGYGRVTLRAATVFGMDLRPQAPGKLGQHLREAVGTEPVEDCGNRIGSFRIGCLSVVAGA